MQRCVVMAMVCLGFRLAGTSAQTTTQPAEKRSDLRIAVCQFEVTADVKVNAEQIRQQMRTARQKGAEIAQFCECALPGYPEADFPSLANFDWALLRSETQAIVDLAGELHLWVVLGSIHPLSEDHKPHDSLYVISPEGRIVDRYDKRFCTRSDLKCFTPGDHFVVFDIHGIKCGLLICFDLGYPELYREYSKLGAQVIFHSFYNARGKEHYRERARMTTAMGAAHAVLNYFYISLCNTSGPLGWPSFVVAPDAEVLATAPDRQASVLVTTVNTSENRYDFTRAFRDKALAGILNSGELVRDDRSVDRKGY